MRPQTQSSLSILADSKKTRLVGIQQPRLGCLVKKFTFHRPRVTTTHSNVEPIKVLHQPYKDINRKFKNSSVTRTCLRSTSSFLASLVLY